MANSLVAIAPGDHVAPGSICWLPGSPFTPPDLLTDNPIARAELSNAPVLSDLLPCLVCGSCSLAFSCSIVTTYRTTSVVDEGDQGTLRGCVGLRGPLSVAIACVCVGVTHLDRIVCTHQWGMK